MTARDRLHALVNRLPDSGTDLAERLLEDLLEDLVGVALRNAPLDDEPETDAERAAFAEGKAACGRGEHVTNEELRRELNCDRSLVTVGVARPAETGSGQGRTGGESR